MKFLAPLLLSLGIATSVQAQQRDSLVLRKIYDEALTNGKSYSWLRDLSYGIGARLSGSPQAEQAVIWTKAKLESIGLDSVFLQPVMVPHWVRGDKEELMMISGGQSAKLSITALGNSVGTKGQPVVARVIEVQSIDELRKLGKEAVAGKIVFFNRPMNPLYISTFNAYSDAVDQRSRGASEAGKLGAVAVLVRSMTLKNDDVPHTGALTYNDSFPKIPAAALSIKAANELSAQLKKRIVTDISLTLSCEMLPEVESYNVVGEIRGSKYPKQYIVVGGHLDSWDTGDGAHDDGAGCVQSMEALRIFRTLGIKPAYSVRVVLFMNEENGLRGGRKYAELAQANTETHIAAIESDRGGFSPRGFAYEAQQKDKFKSLLRWKSLFAPYGVNEFEEGGGGSDIGPLKSSGTVCIGFVPDSQRYFDVHHSASDTFESINQRELELGAAGMASLLYLISAYGL